MGNTLGWTPRAPGAAAAAILLCCGGITSVGAGFLSHFVFVSQHLEHGKVKAKQTLGLHRVQEQVTVLVVQG